MSPKPNEISEYSIEEMMNWPPNGFAKLIHPKDRAFVMNQARKKQAGEKDVMPHYSCRIIIRSGEIRWVDQYSKTIVYEGRPANFVTIIDITERKQTENDRLDLEESRTEFVAMTSHELRTPLTSIRGYVEIL